MEPIKRAVERARQERSAARDFASSDGREKPSGRRRAATTGTELVPVSGSVKVEPPVRPVPVAADAIPDQPRRSRPVQRPAESTGPSAPVELLEGLQTRLLAQISLAKLGCIAFVGTAAGDGVSALSTAFAVGLAAKMDERVVLLRTVLGNSESGGPILRQTVSLEDLLSLNTTILDGLVPEQGVVCVVSSKCSGNSLGRSLRAGDFAYLLSELRRRFDHIIIDCPPLPSSNESLAIAREADGVILTVRAGVTRKRVALAALRLMEKSGIHPLGAVLNRRRHFIPSWLYRRL